MYLGVDVGGTKTLVALFNENGELKNSQKFPTPPDYADFLQQLEQTVAALSPDQIAAVCVAIPGRVDREHGVGIRFGNLPWSNVPIKADLERIFDCPTLVENDAKLAGLSEAKLILHEFNKVLYITISTGIGIALIIDGVIDTDFGDRGGNSMLMEHEGQLLPWESFASGKAIVARYGKKASELDDPEIWKILAGDFAIGMIDLISVIDPQVVVIGGGVGAHFKKFEQPLKEILNSYATPMMTIPPIVQAKHPEEAVIYGCYDLIKDNYDKLVAAN